MKFGKKYLKFAKDFSSLSYGDNLILCVRIYVAHEGLDIVLEKCYVLLTEQEYCKIKMLAIVE